MRDPQVLARRLTGVTGAKNVNHRKLRSRAGATYGLITRARCIKVGNSEQILGGLPAQVPLDQEGVRTKERTLKQTRHQVPQTQS